MDNFSITDPQTPKRCIEALNDSFNSIKDLVANYQPKTTQQDYAVLYYVGPIVEGNKIYVKTPVEAATPVFAQYYGALKYVGDLVDTTLAFSTTLSTEENEMADFIIYQPYRVAIVKDDVGLNNVDMFYRNPEEDIHQ